MVRLGNKASVLSGVQGVKQIASGNLLYDTWSSKLVLCDSLESWEGGDIYISMADS